MSEMTIRFVEGVDFDVWVSKTVLRHTMERMSALICDCMDENGKPKAPSAKTLAMARQFLPADMPGTFDKKR